MNNKTEIRCFKRYKTLTENKGEDEELPGEEVESKPVTTTGYTSSQWTPAEDELLKAKVA